MPRAGRDRRRRATGAEVDRRQVVAHLTRAVTAVGGVPLTELPGAVLAPALHGGGVEDRARVVAAGCDRCRRAAGTEVDGGEDGTHLTGHVAAVDRVAETELAGGVVAPALHGTGVEQRACVRCSGRDGRHGVLGADVDRREEVAHLAGPVAGVAGLGLTELAPNVATPALHRQVVE